MHRFCFALCDKSDQHRFALSRRLSTSSLTGGSTTGSWAWTNDGIIPTVTNSGYEVTFTPTDTTNYDWIGVTVKQNVAITVNKAAGDATTGTATVTYTPTLTVADALSDYSAYTFASAGNSLTVADSGIQVTGYKDNADPSNYNQDNIVVTITVNKASGAAVSGAPTVNGTPTSNSIMVNGVTNAGTTGQTVEYAITTSAVFPATGWQSGTTFTGLSPSTAYYVYARTAESANYNFGIDQRSSEITTAAAPVTYTVTINGSYTGTSGAGSYTAGATVTINAGSRGSYSFNGWTVNNGGVVLANSNNAVTTFTMPANAVTVTANWTAISPTTYTVTFNGNGGTPSEAWRTVAAGAAVGTLPTATRPGYTFDGWFTAASGGTQITAGIIITGNVTFYAQWTSVDGVTSGTSTYTVTFDLNGGMRTGGGALSQSIQSGYSAIAPTVVRDGYTFDGVY